MQNIVFGLVTASATVAGGLWVASRPRTWLTPARLASLMSIGGGLLLASVIFELLPSAIEHGGHLAYFYLMAGLLTVVLFERYVAPRLNFLVAPGDGSAEAACEAGCTHEAPKPAMAAAMFADGAVAHAYHGHAHDHAHHHHHHELTLNDEANLLSHGAACSALGCLLVCTFFDGVAMAAGFGVSPALGIVLSIGLLLHLIPEGVVASSVVLAAGSSRKAAVKAAFGVGFSLVLGLLLATVLGEMFGFLGVALPFATGVILFVVLAQLLPIALRSASGVPLFVSMACLFGVLERLVPHAH